MQPDATRSPRLPLVVGYAWDGSHRSGEHLTWWCGVRHQASRRAESTRPQTQWITRAIVTLRIRLGLVFAGCGPVWAGGEAVPDGDLLGADEDVFERRSAA
jgi:hypothetical protein